MEQMIQIHFLTHNSIQRSTLPYKSNIYGQKEIIVGGSGYIWIYNLAPFTGRISRIVSRQLERQYWSDWDFFNAYNTCSPPKLICSENMKLDIITDVLYMDQTQYKSQVIPLYGNGFIFVSWVKLDFADISKRESMLLIRGTINLLYTHKQILGDQSFFIKYDLDLFENKSSISMESYSYKIPQKDTIENSGAVQSFNAMDYQDLHEGIQKWHFLKFYYGTFDGHKSQKMEIYFPQLFRYYYYFNFNGLGANQFTTDKMYLHIGTDKFVIQSQFKGEIQGMSIITCISPYYQISALTPICHYTCKQSNWCDFDHCGLCAPNSNRYLVPTQFCICNEGYYAIENQVICQKFTENYKYLQFSQLPLVTLTCQPGFFHFQGACSRCPQTAVTDNVRISCVDCINQKYLWYLKPTCYTDYIKLIGNENEPYFMQQRAKNDVDLYKINSQGYLELCTGCYQYCESEDDIYCFLSNHYHLDQQMIVECKSNYYFDQTLKLCQQCGENCNICDSQGQCQECSHQHYYNPYLHKCSQCDIRCQECQFDSLSATSICTSCPQYQTLYNGTCLRCGTYCKFCLPQVSNTGEIYARCFQCLEYRQYFISFDAVNCHQNTIKNCIYAIQYVLTDRHIQTIDTYFEPRKLDSTIATICAKCISGYLYYIQDGICYNIRSYNVEYVIQEPNSSLAQCLSGHEEKCVQILGGCEAVMNCEACIYSKTNVLQQCSWCDNGYYMQKLRGNCLPCPKALNCLACAEQQKLNKDHYKLEFKAFYEYFVNFDGYHDYEQYAQSKNQEDYEIVCTICHTRHQPQDGRCVPDCAYDCAECIYTNGQFQCVKCHESIQGNMLTLVDNQCIQCPYNCAACLPQTVDQIYYQNPYFSNLKYQHTTNVCLKPILGFDFANYFYDSDIYNFVKCESKEICQNSVSFQMNVFCNDQEFEKQRVQAANQTSFQQRNIKFSQLFSRSTDSHVPEYENDEVYFSFNQQNIKIINQTYIFTDQNECVITDGSFLQSLFSSNVFSVRQININMFSKGSPVKIYFSNYFQIATFSSVHLQNIIFINTELFVVNTIFIQHLINVDILLEQIQLLSLGAESFPQFKFMNTTSVRINDLKVQNITYTNSRLIDIQSCIWESKETVSKLSKLSFTNVDLINCTFHYSSLINNVFNIQYTLTMTNIYINSVLNSTTILTDISNAFSKQKTLLITALKIKSKIINTSSFINCYDIQDINLSELSIEDSSIINSTFLKCNNEFKLETAYFNNLSITGKSKLLSYQSGKLNGSDTISINNITISNVKYEQIHCFMYFSQSGSDEIILVLEYMKLFNNSLADSIQKSLTRIFQDSALILIDLPIIMIQNTEIGRNAGYVELFLKNTKKITIHNLLIYQLTRIQGLHQYLDCQKIQILGEHFYSVIRIFNSQLTYLSNIQVQTLTVYNYAIIEYQSLKISDLWQDESVSIKNCSFMQNTVIISKDIQSSALIYINSEQNIKVSIEDLKFINNLLQKYIGSIQIQACLINLQMHNGQININQLRAFDNLITNSTFSLFYIDAQSINLLNFIVRRNNLFEFETVQKQLMWQSDKLISIESLQKVFPVKSDGIFKIIFENLYIEQLQIEKAQGCSGGGLYLRSKGQSNLKIINSTFSNIQQSINCDDSNGGAIYIDCSDSDLITILDLIEISDIMSLNKGGFIYLYTSNFNIDISINNIVANNFQSLQGSFIHAAFQQSNKKQFLKVTNCSLINSFDSFIKYLGYLSVFEIAQRPNILENRVQFYLEYGNVYFTNITIHSFNQEAIIQAISCIELLLFHLTVSGGNYTNKPILDIQQQVLLQHKLNFQNIQVLNLEFNQHTFCSKEEAFNIQLLTFVCHYETIQQYFYQPPNKIVVDDFLINRGQCFLQKANQEQDWSSFSIVRINYIYSYHLIRISNTQFQNIQCVQCQQGILYMNFQQSQSNRVRIINLHIFNSSCGNLGCLLLSSQIVNQQNLLTKNRRLNEFDKDYNNMNFTFLIQEFQCINNQANYGVCLFINQVELQIIDSYFKNNTAKYSGGAIYSLNSNNQQLSIIKTTISSNQALLGNNVIYQNQILPNLTKAQTFLEGNSNKSRIHYNLNVPQILKITNSQHQYLVQNEQYIETNNLSIEISNVSQILHFPNGQSLQSYKYFDLKLNKYLELNQSFRLSAMNQFDQEQIKIEGTICQIYSRIVDSIDALQEFDQILTKQTKVEFNQTTLDYNLDDLIIYFDYDLPSTMFFQLQFKCDSIRIPIYDTINGYNIVNWHDAYYLRTSLIRPLPCQLGEIKDIETKTCQLCNSNYGLYSVKFNSNKCEQKNELTTISVTAAQLNLKPFYWRPYINSNEIELCFNLQNNCLGGWNFGDDFCYLGHIGALCEQCDLYNIRGEGQFSISNSYTCGSCQSINQNILIICLVSIFTLVSIIISVKSTDDLVTDLSHWTSHISTGILVANQKAMAGILIKILTNYLQIFGSLSTFKLQMPNWISSVIITSSDPIQSMAYSLDCFLIDMFKVPILYGRIIWHLIMPIIYILAAIIMFYFIKKKSKEILRFGIISTILIYTIIFLQPNIIKSLISLISYRNISGYKWVQGLVAYRYDSDQHQEWLKYLIILIVFIGVLIPLYFYYKLLKIKDNLNNIDHRSTWGFLYNEYSKWAYYWEIVKILLKEIIIIILTYYEDSIFLKAILVNLSIVFYSHYLLKWKPYNLSFLNKLENLSSRTCSISMIIGLGIYASQQQNITEVQYPFYLVLFILNINFLTKILSKIGFAYLDKFQIQIDQLKTKINQRFPHLKHKIPQCSRFLENKTQKKQQIKFAFRRLVNSIMIQLKNTKEKKSVEETIKQQNKKSE